jgi:two-component system chemotaxis response regulator CheB
MANRDIIVIGASAGGVEALSDFFSGLPANLEATIFVVLHIPPYSPSSLPVILTRCGHMSASHPKDGEEVRPGQVYIAPPDHHLLVELGRVLIKRGPKENRFRPSVDALFRSAAYAYGRRVIGIVLSGALDDGTSGLWTIKRLGGVAIVQQPEDACVPNMPRSVAITPSPMLANVTCNRSR